MIKNIKEIHNTISSKDKFYSWIICEVDSGFEKRYNLYRVNGSSCKSFGQELPLNMCRDIIKSKEPGGTRVLKFKLEKPKRGSNPYNRYYWGH